MANEWDKWKDEIVNAVKDRVKNFLKQNVKALEYLEDRAGRLAQLTWQRALVADGEPDAEKRRERISKAIAMVTQTINNDVAALQIEANDQAKAIFASVLTAVGQLLSGALPDLFKIIK